jgi:uncharacterized protein
MKPELSRLEPGTASDRIPYLDTLRGIALFGILVANMRGFNAPLAIYTDISPLFPGKADAIVQTLMLIFVQAKFVALFAFLFGLGFAVQMTRAEARGVSLLSFYPRRLIALAIFGLIHGLLIWWGDILLSYALSGTLLLLFRNRSQKAVLAWAGGLTALSMIIFARLFFAAPHGGAMPNRLAAIQHSVSVFSHGTYPAILRENMAQWQASFLTQFRSPFGFYPFTVFLLGLFVWRTGIITRLHDFRPLMKRICFICIPLGVVLNAVLVLAPTVIKSPAGMPLVAKIAGILVWPILLTLSAGYASGVALLLQSNVRQQRLAPFAFVGRMALTNYIMQSIVCTLFFYTTRLYGRMGPALDLIPSVALYSTQVAFSIWWLKRFRFGPLEWVWRGMTYGQLPALRKEPETAPEFVTQEV